MKYDQLFVRGLVGALAARWHSGGHNIIMRFYKNYGPAHCDMAYDPHLRQPTGKIMKIGSFPLDRLVEKGRK